MAATLPGLSLRRVHPKFYVRSDGRATARALGKNSLDDPDFHLAQHRDPAHFARSGRVVDELSVVATALCRRNTRSCCDRAPSLPQTCGRNYCCVLCVMRRALLLLLSLTCGARAERINHEGRILGPAPVVTAPT